MKWKIFIKILKNTIRIKDAKYCLFLIANMFSNKKVTPVVTDDLLEIENKFFFLLLLHNLFFSVNSTRYFIMEIPDQQELQQTEINYLSNIEFKDFMKFYKKKRAAKSYSYLVIDCILPLDNPLHFRKNHSKRI